MQPTSTRVQSPQCSPRWEIPRFSSDLTSTGEAAPRVVRASPTARVEMEISVLPPGRGWWISLCAGWIRHRVLARTRAYIPLAYFSLLGQHLARTVSLLGQHLALVLLTSILASFAAASFGCLPWLPISMYPQPLGLAWLWVCEYEKTRKLPQVHCHPLSSMRVRIELLTLPLLSLQED